MTSKVGEEDQNLNGFFAMSTIAKRKVAAKRERKGYGELKSRNRNVYEQLGF